MRRGSLGIADKIALIALVGIIASVGVWLAYAFVGGVIFQGQDLSTAFAMPSAQQAWNRLVAIVMVLIGTILVQALTARRVQIEHQLHLEKSRTRQMYENSPDGVICMDAERRLLYGNLHAEEMAGGSIDLEAQSLCYEAVYRRSAPCPGCDLEEVLRTGEPSRRTDEEFALDGTRRYLSKLLYPIRDAEGRIESVVETARDITDLRLAEQELINSHQQLETRIEARTAELRETNERLQGEVAARERVSKALRDSEERYRRLIEHSPDMILVHQYERVSFLNPAGLRLIGAGGNEEALGREVLTLWSPDENGLSAEDLRRTIIEGEGRGPVPAKLRRLDGGLVDVEVTVSRLQLDGEDFVQCVARDITERLEAEETIKQMAFYDSLTGLPNRALFTDRLDIALQRARRTSTPVAVAFLDLDDFKVINDTLGHQVGDELLRSVGARVSALLRENDTVARHSGDEFTIIAELKHLGDAEMLAERVLEGLRPSFTVAGHELHVTGSLGIAIYPDHGQEREDLLKNADTAMYLAKELGQSQYRLYLPEMSEAARDRLTLETELRRAVEGREFELYYQPQVDLETGEIRGVEALLRWHHPERGLLLPGEFLAVAEQAGLISHVGRWVLAEACTQTRAWMDMGLNPGRVAVNLSAREFMQRNVVELVRQTLLGTGLPPEMLEIEITESVAIHNLEHVLATLSRLRNEGVRIAIDDFGTGYSSMSYLQRFPIQTLKIAQTFMRRVGEDEQSAAIASLLVELCRELDLDVVAEGVENVRQRDFLTGRGCVIVQGNLFCEPRPADEMASVLAAGVLGAHV